MSLEFIQGDVFTGIDKGTQKSVTELCSKIATQAKLLAPVAPKYGGTLRDSIGYKTKAIETADPKLSEKPKQYEGYVGTSVLYGIYQEFGTRKMKAQPFLVPAIDIVKNGTSATDAVKNAMNGEIVKAIAKKRIIKL